MVVEAFTMDGQVAIVTGASRGIGAAVAVGFAESGADVVLGARSAEGLETVASQIRALGRKATPIAGSLHRREGLEALVGAAMDEHGFVSTVVNNVGGSMPSAFLDITEAEFDAALRWNVTTAFNLTQLAVPHMLERTGSVINIASMAGVHASRGFSAYGTAKAAMIQLTRTMAQDLSPRVRVNAIAPGAIATAALDAVLTDETHDAMVAATPMRRLGRPADIAAAAVYLASPAASYVTGHILAVCGGIESTNFDMGLPDL